ncbi:hypothetical protein BJ165DRAFT_1516981 [Panaeolus papilionaceus]|nr:hypothetical protein BJ165DRAFT_1516981 [Panaeolus papilionaceus]
MHSASETENEVIPPPPPLISSQRTTRTFSLLKFNDIASCCGRWNLSPQRNSSSYSPYTTRWGVALCLCVDGWL